MRRLFDSRSTSTSVPAAESSFEDAVPSAVELEPRPVEQAALLDDAVTAEAPALAEPEPVKVGAAAQPIPAEAIPAEVEAEPIEAPRPAPPAGDGLVLRLETERAEAPTFEVGRTGATLGRGTENTIRLEDLSVSRKHARISYRQGGYWLTDLGSMGGTWVNGVKLNAARRIETGQTIDIGVCRLTVTSAGDEPGMTAAAAGQRRRRR